MLVLSNIQNEESILLEVLINFFLVIILVHRKHHSLGNCADFHSTLKRCNNYRNINRLIDYYINKHQEL